MKKPYDYSKLIENMIPSEEAVAYLQQLYIPISYTDFTGYAVDLGCMFPYLCKEKCFCLLISQDGEIGIVQFQGSKKKLSKKKIKKFIKELKYTLFLIPRPMPSPFIEFDQKFEIPIDIDKVIIVEQRLLTQYDK